MQLSIVLIEINKTGTRSHRSRQEGRCANQMFGSRDELFEQFAGELSIQWMSAGRWFVSAHVRKQASSHQMTGRHSNIHF